MAVMATWTNLQYCHSCRLPQKDDLRSSWVEAISKHQHFEPTAFSICENHFSKNDFTRKRKHHVGSDGSVEVAQNLKSGAIPSIFPTNIINTVDMNGPQHDSHDTEPSERTEPTLCATMSVAGNVGNGISIISNLSNTDSYKACHGCLKQNMTIIRLQNKIASYEKAKLNLQQKLADERNNVAILQKENKQLREAEGARESNNTSIVRRVYSVYSYL